MNMPCHLPHGERIPDQQTYYVRRAWAKLMTKDGTLIEAHKLHQINWADSLIDHSLQLTIVFCLMNGFIKLLDVGMTNLSLNRSHHLGKGFRGNDAESIDRNLLRRHLTLLL